MTESHDLANAPSVVFLLLGADCSSTPADGFPTIDCSTVTAHNPVNLLEENQAFPSSFFHPHLTGERTRRLVGNNSPIITRSIRPLFVSLLKHVRKEVSIVHDEGRADDLAQIFQTAIACRGYQ
jgi:hypothetical protein